MKLTHENIQQHLTGLPSATQRGLHTLFSAMLDEIHALRDDVVADDSGDPLLRPDPDSGASANEDTASDAPESSDDHPVPDEASQSKA